MKKLGIYLMTLALVAMTFVACNEDDPTKPEIAINNGVDIDVEKIANSDATFTLPVTVTAEDENISSVRVYITTDGANFVVEEAANVKAKNFTREYALSDIRPIYLDIKDQGLTMKTLEVQVATPTHLSTIKSQAFVYPAPVDTPLSEAATTTWVRAGSVEGTGLTDFGLKFESNIDRAWYTSIVKKDAEKFVSFTKAQWNDIQTKEGLAAAVEAANEITNFRKISANAGMPTIDEVLATKYNGKYYIILLKNSTVVTGDKTTVTINGEYRN